MRLMGIKWVVGRALERCFPFGHKAAIASDLAICSVELSSVMAVSLTQGMGCLVALGAVVLLIEVTGRRLSAAGPVVVAPSKPPIGRRLAMRHRIKMRVARWCKSPVRLRSRRKTAAEMSP